MRQSKIHLFIIPILFLTLFSSCKPEEVHPIPDIYMNFTINLMDDPEFFFLQTQGNAAIIRSYSIGALSLGYNDNGIIIYNSGFYEFMAFDATCPYDLPQNVAVDISEISGVATCPVCGSQYVFTSMGTPTLNSPARWPLKEYNASYNPNTGSLTISH
jgi:hypothetical protein